MKRKLSKALFTTNTLLDTRRWVYWLDETDVAKARDGVRRFRVCIVFENEPGFRPTGNGDQAPWYWDKETCRDGNANRGFDERACWEIVSSSMFPRPSVPSIN